MRVKIIVSGLVAGFVAVSSSQLWAQSTNAPSIAPSTNLPPRMHAPAGGPAARQGLLGVLTDDQVASFQKARATQNEKLMELRPKIQAAQQEVFDAGLSPKFDENLVRQKAQAAAQIYTEILMAQAKAFSEIEPPLTAEQIEKIKALASPPTNPRILQRQPPPGATTNHLQNGLPSKQ